MCWNVLPVSRRFSRAKNQSRSFQSRSFQSWSKSSRGGEIRTLLAVYCLRRTRRTTKLVAQSSAQSLIQVFRKKELLFRIFLFKTSTEKLDETQHRENFYSFRPVFLSTMTSLLSVDHRSLPEVDGSIMWTGRAPTVEES